MNFNEKDIVEILQALEVAKSFAPMADKVVETIFAYGPSIGKLVDGIVDYQVGRTIKSFYMYLEAGFSREEAMLLTLNTRIAIQEVTDKFPKELKSTKRTK